MTIVAAKKKKNSQNKELRIRREKSCRIFLLFYGLLKNFTQNSQKEWNFNGKYLEFCRKAFYNHICCIFADNKSIF